MKKILFIFTFFTSMVFAANLNIIGGGGGGGDTISNSLGGEADFNLGAGAGGNATAGDVAGGGGGYIGDGVSNPTPNANKDGVNSGAGGAGGIGAGGAQNGQDGSAGGAGGNANYSIGGSAFYDNITIKAGASGGGNTGGAGGNATLSVSGDLNSAESIFITRENSFNNSKASGNMELNVGGNLNVGYSILFEAPAGTNVMLGDILFEVGGNVSADSLYLAVSGLYDNSTGGNTTFKVAENLNIDTYIYLQGGYTSDSSTAGDLLFEVGGNVSADSLYLAVSGLYDNSTGGNTTFKVAENLNLIYSLDLQRQNVDLSSITGDLLFEVGGNVSADYLQYSTGNANDNSIIGNTTLKFDKNLNVNNSIYLQGGYANNNATLGDLLFEVGGNASADYLQYSTGNANDNSIIGNTTLKFDKNLNVTSGIFLVAGSADQNSTFGDILFEVGGNLSAGYFEYSGSSAYDNGATGNVALKVAGNINVTTNGISFNIGTAAHNSVVGDMLFEAGGNVSASDLRFHASSIYNNGTIGNITFKFAENLNVTNAIVFYGISTWTNSTLGDMLFDFGGNVSMDYLDFRGNYIEDNSTSGNVTLKVAGNLNATIISFQGGQTSMNSTGGDTLFEVGGDVWSNLIYFFSGHGQDLSFKGHGNVKTNSLTVISANGNPGNYYGDNSNGENGGDMSFVVDKTVEVGSFVSLYQGVYGLNHASGALGGAGGKLLFKVGTLDFSNATATTTLTLDGTQEYNSTSNTGVFIDVIKLGEDTNIESLTAGNMSFRNIDVSKKESTLTYTKEGVGDIFNLSHKSISFTLPSDITTADSMLNVPNGINIQGATINLLSASHELTNLALNDTLTLIYAANGVSGTLGSISSNAIYGATGYSFEFVVEPQYVKSILKSLQQGIYAKPYLEIGAAKLGQQNIAYDNFLSELSNFNKSSNGYHSFGKIQGYDQKFKSGSHVDADGSNIIVGGYKVEDNLITGAFFEAGFGSYNSFNSFPATTIKGNGDNDYYGVGVFGKYDLPNNFYVDSSIRLGYTRGDFSSSQMNSSFDSDTLYYGAHAGVGYKWLAHENGIIEPYTKIVFTHQHSDKVETSAGETLKLDSTNSIRTRIGLKYAYELSNYALNFYGGVAWDYEHAAEQDGRILTTSYSADIDAPSLGGSTGIFELGTRLQVSNSWSIGASLTGVVGEREGFSGSLSADYKF